MTAVVIIIDEFIIVECVCRTCQFWAANRRHWRRLPEAQPLDLTHRVLNRPTLASLCPVSQVYTVFHKKGSPFVFLTIHSNDDQFTQKFHHL